MSWYSVKSSQGELLEYPKKPSMRRIKADLLITGRKIKLIHEGYYYKIYKLSKSEYTFTVTEIC